MTNNIILGYVMIALAVPAALAFVAFGRARAGQTGIVRCP